MQHYLRPLLAPASVALVGASERPASVGRIVLENIVAGGYAGDLFVVNPHHRKVLGRRAHKSLATIGKPVDLAVIAAPSTAVAAILDDAPRAQLQAALLLTVPPADNAIVARRWTRDIAALATKRGVRLVGPGTFGLIRTDIHLNATYSDVPVRAGGLALIAQSGAVCTAMLDFAAPMGIGFSSVIALGGGMDVGFGELLDALVIDPSTDAILLYVEHVTDVRRFVSALRAAARTKPVVVLRSGRSQDQPRRDGGPAADAVFDAAFRRAGTVRVHTYTQLFAAARILAMGKIPHGDRLAIVANGRGPALLAADSAAGRGVTLAPLEASTIAALDTLLPVESARANPVDVRGDAPPERFAAAVAATLSDPGVDAVLALHVPRPIDGPTDAARAIAAVARGSSKPVLGAWLGSIERLETRAALEAGGIANFYTPENAVEAFSFLAAYRRNQALLLEVAPPQADPAPPDLAVAARIREQLLADGRSTLRGNETHALLSAFDMPLPALATVDTLAEALTAARRVGYPLGLMLDAAAPALARFDLANKRALTRAWSDLHDEARATPPKGWSGGALVFRAPRVRGGSELAIGLATDPTFGPVITFGPSARLQLPGHGAALMLPPLNARLAADLIVGGTATRLSTECAAALAPLTRLLLQLSTLACELPWIRELALDPVLVAPGAALIGRARVVASLARKLPPRYAHMAIHPYPAELAADVTLAGGQSLHVRPIRPEDAELERRFVNGLSDQSRYFRFFYQLHELTPQMLARFTQVDYDRELALVALVDDPRAPEGQSFVGVARYIMNPDRESAEFAIVVADAWQGRGVARMLMQRLIAGARKRGLKRLEGSVLQANRNMLRFVEKLGFTVRDDPDDPEQVTAVLALG